MAEKAKMEVNGGMIRATTPMRAAEEFRVSGSGKTITVGYEKYEQIITIGGQEYPLTVTLTASIPATQDKLERDLKRLKGESDGSPKQDSAVLKTLLAGLAAGKEKKTA
jgi:hypothetical protein